MEKDNEIRTIESQLSVRESASDAQGESRTICGTAIVFNRESEVLDDFGFRFRETIDPEACTKEWLDTQDIKMNMLHDRSMTIARSNKGQGSLRLSVDKEGVHFEFEAPKDYLGDHCLEMVRRGDYSGCSFEFKAEKYDIDDSNREDVRVHHRKFARVTALTIGMDPAYRQTSVNARELHSSVVPEPKDNGSKREIELKLQAEARMRELEQMKRETEILSLL